MFADGAGELIHYVRADADGPKLSDYVIAPVTDPQALSQALQRACGLLGRVRKQRLLLWVGTTRLHLDRVDGLGDFLELEVVLGPGQSPADGQRQARALMAALGLADADLVAGAYLDLQRARSA